MNISIIKKVNILVVKKNVILIVFIVLAFATSAADDPIDKKVSLDFFVMYGIEGQNNGNLNLFLSENNYYHLSELQLPNYLAIGIDLRSVNDPFISQIIISKNGNNFTSVENNSSITSYGLAANVLYNLSKDKKWTFAPLLGLGINNNTLIAVSKANVSVLSNSLLEENFQQKGAFELKVGANVERKIIISKYTFNIGMNAYYNLSIGNKHWYSSNNSILNNIPPIGNSGLGILFKIGFISK